MTSEELEQAIRDMSIRIYCKEYTGEIRCTPLNPVGWSVYLGIHGPKHGILISAELPDDKFLTFFEKELRMRDFGSVEWYRGYRADEFDMNKDGKITTRE